MEIVLQIMVKYYKIHDKPHYENVLHTIDFLYSTVRILPQSMDLPCHNNYANLFIGLHACTQVRGHYKNKALFDLKLGLVLSILVVNKTL